MGINIGSIFIKLAAEIADFKNDMQKATRILNDNVRKMQRGLKGLNTALAAVGVGLLVNKLQDLGGQLVKTADKFNQLKGRVKNSLDSVNEFEGTFRKLIESSNRTGASMDTIAQAFTRLRPAALELGKTNDDLIRFNETFLKMGSLAGATSEEISNAMIQLSQGLASGALRGDELRSVMEQMPMVARTIADSMGIPFSEFKKAAEDGQITAEAVFKAIIDEADKTDEAFSKLPGSVDRAMTRITNSLKLLLDDLNEATNTTNILSAAMNDLADSIESYSIQNLDANTTTGAFNVIMEKLGDTCKLLIDGFGDLWNTLDLVFQEISGGYHITDALMGLLDGLVSIVHVAAMGFKTFTNAIYTSVDAMSELIRLNPLGALNALKEGYNRELTTSGERIGKFYMGNNQGFAFAPLAIPDRTPARARMPFSGYGGADKKKKGRKGRTGKSDLEREMDHLKSKAESLRESVRKPWEIFNEGVAEADKLLNMHLISLETYNRVVQDLGTKTDNMIEVKGLDEAMERFMQPIEQGADSILEDFAEGLNKVNESASKQLDVLKSLESPQEDYFNKVAEISELFNTGWLSIDQYTQALDNLNKEGQSSLGDLESAIFSMGTSFEQSFLQFTQTGKFAFKDMVTSMLNDLARLVFQLTVIQPLFGGSKANGGKGGIFTNLISSAVGGLFGGGMSKVKMYDYAFGPAFANGGQTPANQPFMVGERGPEIMSFDRPGYVTPNHKLGGMGGGSGSVVVNQTFNISTGVQQTVRAEIANMMPQIEKQTTGAVTKAISRGGTIAKAVGVRA